MIASERIIAFGQMCRIVRAERAPFGYLLNRAGTGDEYVIDCTRQQLEESPRSLLHDLCEQFKQQPRDRLRVHFQGEAGVDAGGLGRQFGDGIAEEKQEWMKRWIENADDAKIKQFLFAMSGSSSLGRKPLSVEKSGDNIYFHTCFNTVDIPMDGIETEELFASLINTTIVG